MNERAQPYPSGVWPGTTPRRTSVRRRVATLAFEHRIAVLALLSAVVFYTSLNRDLYTWGDSVRFIVAAKSLATGQGLTNIHLAEPTPFEFPIPVFPLMLAPFVPVLLLAVPPAVILSDIKGLLF